MKSPLRLCWCHTVPKLMPEGHMNMSLWHLLREFVGMPKIPRCPPGREVDPVAGEPQPGSYEGLRIMRSRISQCFYNVLRCSYDHFQNEAGLIVCPSAVNFGTVCCALSIGPQRATRGCEISRRGMRYPRKSQTPGCAISRGLRFTTTPVPIGANANAIVNQGF